ncbi:MAG: hypothetical protein Q8903_05020 [Bacteroidota bacterium]|nr:hypothetical protein [Bacteroidota bacterium]
MRYIIVLFTFGLLFTACSSKVAEISMINQEPCKEQLKLDAQNKFYGETVNNFTLNNQSGVILANMDVRTYCDAKLAFKIDKQDKVVKIKVMNTNSSRPDCVCLLNVQTAIKNLPSGDYSFMVTNEGGDKLLAEQKLSIK